MANMLNPLLPYILQEALGVYKTRAHTAGREAGDFDPLMALLGNFQNQYTQQARQPSQNALAQAMMARRSMPFEWDQNADAQAIPIGMGLGGGGGIGGRGIRSSVNAF